MTDPLKRTMNSSERGLSLSDAHWWQILAFDDDDAHWDAVEEIESIIRRATIVVGIALDNPDEAVSRFLDHLVVVERISGSGTREITSAVRKELKKLSDLVFEADCGDRERHDVLRGLANECPKVELGAIRLGELREPTIDYRFAARNQHLPKRDEGSDQPEDWITERIELQTLRDLRTGLDNISQKIRDAQNDPSYRIDPSWRRQLQILFGEMVSAGIQTADCDFDENPDSVLGKIHAARTSVQLRMGWLEIRVAAHKRPTRNSLGATTHASIDPLQVPGEFRQLSSQSEQNVAKSGHDSAQQSARRTRGAPQKPVAEKTRARWIEMGKPEKLDAAVCDQLAQHSYPEEFAKASPHSAARKRLRDRVASQVRWLVHKTATPT